MKLPRRFSGSPMKPRGGGVAPARKRRPANSAAPPRLVARGKDGVGSLYEVEGEDCGELHEGQEAQEPFLYRFVVPDGYTQLRDPQSGAPAGTFVRVTGGGADKEYLELRGRMGAVDATMAKMRAQMEWLDEEMARLDAEKEELGQRLAAHAAAAGAQCELSVAVLPSAGVEHLPIPDEELQELASRAEAAAQEALPHGGEYAVAHTGEHEHAAEAAQLFVRQEDEGDAVDGAEWRGWEALCRAGGREVAVLLLRRKYVPDAGLQFQDILLRWCCDRVAAPASNGGGGGVEAGGDGEEGLSVLRGVAGTVAPVSTRRHPLEWDGLDVQGHLDKLAADEGYMHFFARRLEPPKNRPSMCDLADAAVAKLAEPHGGGGGGGGEEGAGVDEFEDSIDAVGGAAPLTDAGARREQAAAHAAAAEGARGAGPVAEAWAQVEAMVKEESNNGLLVDQLTEWFYTETPDMDRHGLSPAEEAERTHVTEGLKREWGGRVGRLLAFCIDGGTLGARLALRDVVGQITSPASPRSAAERATLERLLEFCVHFRAPGEPFRPGGAPTFWNLGDGIAGPARQAAVASGAARLNDLVLAKLIKLQYVRFVMERDGAPAYTCLLLALLVRPRNTAALTLQVARELAALAAAPEALGALASPGAAAALVRAVAAPDAEERVRFLLATALERLARAAPAARAQLSAAGLPRVLVAQLLRASLRLRTLYLALLRHCYAPQPLPAA